jgi:hypothetical protein
VAVHNRNSCYRIRTVDRGNDPHCAGHDAVFVGNRTSDSPPLANPLPCHLELTHFSPHICLFYSGVYLFKTFYNPHVVHGKKLVSSRPKHSWVINAPQLWLSVYYRHGRRLVILVNTSAVSAHQVPSKETNCFQRQPTALQRTSLVTASETPF